MGDIQDLFVFYGSGLVRDGPYGADLHNCDRTVIRSPNLNTMSLAELRRCVRSGFDRETARNKLRIEAVYAAVGDAGETVCQLIKVTSDALWTNYMEVVCNPDAAIYARPMVYVQFVERTESSAMGGSGVVGGDVEPALLSDCHENDGEEGVNASMGDGDLRRGVDNFQANEGADRWWASRVDCHEYLADEVEEVESEEEEYVETDSSEEEGEGQPTAGGVLGGVVTTDGAYVPSRLDDIAAQSLVLPRAEEAEWGFNEGTLLIGQCFRNKGALQQAIATYAVSISRTYRVHRSNPDTYIVKCVDGSCPGKVRGQRFRGAATEFRITVVKDHTCELAGPLHRHRNMTSSYVAELISHLVLANVCISPKVLMADVANTVGFDVTYKRVWRAKQKVLQRKFGTYEEAYDLVPRMLHQIAEANPGSYINKQERVNEAQGPNCFVLDRVFWAFRQAIEGFKWCRPVLTMDDTFLSGKYKGTILTAVAADANDQLLPVAFAIVENENTDSWLWFLANVKQAVVQDRPEVCVISDRNAGLLSAMRTMQNGTHPPFQWNDMKNRWCMRHLAANFHRRFHSKELMKMFKKLCMQNQRRKFEALWRHLDQETSKHVRRVQQDEAGAVAGGSTRVGEFTQWVNSNAPDLEMWSLLHDTGGARYGIMTTNMSEVYNGVLKGVRSLPITAIVEETWNRSVGYFVNRAMMAKKHLDEGRDFSEVAHAYMHKKMEKSRSHIAQPMDGLRRKFEVRLRQKYMMGQTRGDRKQVCTIDERASCTCNKPQLLHKPCSHVYAACAVWHQTPTHYMSKYYDIKHLFETWSTEFHSYGVDMHYRELWPGQVKWVPNAALKHVGRGRRHSLRIRNDMDDSQRGDRVRRPKCRMCKTVGHSFRQCQKGRHQVTLHSCFRIL